MENIDKEPFEESPTTCLTLQKLSCRTVAKYFSSYNYETIIGLPNPVLDVLKFYLSPQNLHKMMPVLKYWNIDASEAWKFHILAALGKWSLRTCERGFSDDSHHFIVHHKVCPYHQKYISLHCEKLLEKLLAAKENTVKDHPQAYRGLPYFLPSVLYLKMRLKCFKQLDKWEHILAILVQNLQTLIITDFNAQDLQRFDIERITGSLRKFCDNKNLKGIIFERQSFCLDTPCERTKFNELLKCLDNSIASEMKDGKPGTEFHNAVNNTEKRDKHQHNTEAKAPGHGDPDNTESNLFDMAVTSVQSKSGFDEVLKQIDLTQASCPEWMLEPRETTLEAFSLWQGYINEVGHFLPRWQTIRRLSLEGSAYSKANSDLIDDILVKIGCHQFTHLRLAYFRADNLVTRILYILCEYYRKDGEFRRPMELLNLSGVYDIKETCIKSIPLFESELHAVKDFCLVDIKLDQTCLRTLVTFLRLNTCLTSLRLTNVACDSMELPLISMLESLMENRVLQVFSVSGCSLIQHDGKTSFHSAMSSFLNTVQTLSTLQVTFCNIHKQLVTSDEFIEAVQNHPSLSMLSLHSNDLGSVGAQFLTALFKTNKSMRLEELDIRLIWAIATFIYLEDTSFLHMNVAGVVGCGKGIMYLTSLGHPADIDLQLGKVYYPCSTGVVGWCEGVLYLTSPGRLTDIGLQLGKACYPCSSLCCIPGQDLLISAETLIKADIPKPVINKLNISGMILEDKEVGGAEQMRINAEFAKLVDHLEADYYGDQMMDHIANM